MFFRISQKRKLGGRSVSVNSVETATTEARSLGINYGY